MATRLRTANGVGVRTGAALAGTFLMLSSTSVYAAGTTAAQAVAVLGQAAPGGGTFNDGGPSSAFDEPITNPSGHVLVEAQTKSGTTYNEGIYFWDGTLHKVVRQGDVLPGIGTVSANFDAPSLNEPDTVALVNYGMTSGTTTFDAVIHKSKGGSWTFAAKTGQTVPGCTGGPFTFFSFDDISQNDSNDVAIIAEYTDALNKHHAGVFVKYSLQPLTAVVCDGDSLGTGEGTISATFGSDFYTRTDVRAVAINDQGDVAFKPKTVAGGTATPNGSDGVYIKPKGMAIRPLVKVGDPGPPTIGGTITGIFFQSVGLNNQALGLSLDLTGGSSAASVATKGIASGGSLSSCAAVGETAPGTGGATFSSFAFPTLSDNGNLGFSATVGSTDSIFSCRNGVLTPFVLEGDHRPSPTGSFGHLVKASIGGEEFTADYEITFKDAGVPGVYVG
jgi:hypothetical protein